MLQGAWKPVWILQVFCRPVVGHFCQFLHNSILNLTDKNIQMRFLKQKLLHINTNNIVLIQMLSVRCILLNLQTGE